MVAIPSYVCNALNHSIPCICSHINNFCPLFSSGTDRRQNLIWRPIINTTLAPIVDGLTLPKELALDFLHGVELTGTAGAALYLSAWNADTVNERPHLTILSTPFLSVNSDVMVYGAGVAELSASRV
jgi:hypothetical protein